jgi:CRP-like cAMP-binding protein
MSDGSDTKGLRERLTTGTEDKLGRALSDLLDNPLLTGALGRAFDAREKAAQAQELAMGALNLPSAADIERLTRRLRSLSQRLEGIEDGVDRLSRSLSAPKVDARLSSIEDQLKNLSEKIGDLRQSAPRAASPVTSSPRRRATSKSASAPKQAKQSRASKPKD